MNTLGRSRWVPGESSYTSCVGISEHIIYAFYDFNSLCLTLASSEDDRGQILHDELFYCLYCTEVHDTIFNSFHLIRRRRL
jgi:hypothetical protein